MLEMQYDRNTSTLTFNSADITTEYDPTTRSLRIIGLYELPDHEDHYIGTFTGVEHGFTYNGVRRNGLECV